MTVLTEDVRQLITAERPKAMWPVRAQPGGMAVVLACGRIRYLNGVAAIIYALLDGRRTIETIAGELHARFPDVPEDELFEDTLGAIRRFQFIGMVRWKTAD